MRLKILIAIIIFSGIVVRAEQADSLAAAADSLATLSLIDIGDIGGGGGADFAPVLSLDALVAAPSPEAAAMTRHLEEGMDYASGTASLSVPLFSWSVGEIPMNLSLSYRIGAKELTTSFGLNEYDFAARRLSPLGLFTQPDPLAGKYPSLSPYSYCAADPINLIDPTGETIILSGDDDLIERTIKYLNIGLGLDRNIFSIDKDNRIVVNENLDRSTLTDAQYMLYSTIQKAANDETITVAMNIVENSNEIYVGDAYTATVDLADAEVLTKSGLTSP